MINNSTTPAVPPLVPGVRRPWARTSTIHHWAFTEGDGTRVADFMAVHVAGTGWRYVQPKSEEDVIDTTFLTEEELLDTVHARLVKTIGSSLYEELVSEQAVCIRRGL